jgi:Pentapeptide repeats (8 copies)
MTTAELQIWVGILGTLVTIGVSVLGVLNFQSRRDRRAAVGSAFKDLVDGLASNDDTRRMAAAILMRRFFDKHSEQGAARRAYAKETVAVIAGLLRGCETGVIQKVLADGLRYAPSLKLADLQHCNLAGAYLGSKKKIRPLIRSTRVDLTEADLFEADLTAASLKNARARNAVFYRATLVKTVLSGADLTNANFRESQLRGAEFDDARLEGAIFSDAADIPKAIAHRLDSEGRVVSPARPAQ